jgi:arabinogalactan oligomer/maltooligosaccharide transport system substrate-binding protein
MRRYWKIFVLIAVLSAAAAGLTFLLIKKAYDSKHSTGKTAQQAGTEAGLFAGSKETLNLWYTDDSLTDYLNSVAVSYNTGNDRVRVAPKLVSGKDYIKAISDASVKNEDMPDLYLISNDTLEQASLAGLTSEVNKKDSAEFSAKDPAVAVDAVTYKGRIVGYPVYYETSSLLYNKTYLDDWAEAQIEAAQDESAGEAAQETADAQETAQSETADTSAQETAASSGNTDQKEIDAAVTGALPKTIADVETFADTYDAPDDMQAIFKWDVNDIFYNYFFIGSSVDVGGRCGDDGTINIYNSNSIKSLMQYQKLNQFFSIDTSEISYDGVLQDFIDGKILYTVATTDAL